jgi:hypothetical protein
MIIYLFSLHSSFSLFININETILDDALLIIDLHLI